MNTAPKPFKGFKAKDPKWAKWPNPDEEKDREAFRTMLLEQVKECIKDSLGKYTKETSQQPNAIPFSSVFHEQDKWWALYICPEDWYRAIEWAQEQNKAGAATDPSECYDYDESMGFKASMVETYKKYLLPTGTASLGSRVTGDDEDAKVWDWASYLELYKSTCSELEKKEETGIRDVYGGFGFHSGTSLAKDLGEDNKEKDNMEKDKIGDSLALVLNVPAKINERKIKQGGYAGSMYDKDGHMMIPGVLGHALRLSVTRAFTSFQQTILAAGTPKQRLEGIARLIRRLHVLHPFKDGNGRTNVYTLLPALLLHHGFGLPFGGKNAKNLHPAAMFWMFNGGYSVEEIAQFLWVAQDFGDLKPAETYIPKGPGPSHGGHDTSHDDEPKSPDHSHGGDEPSHDDKPEAPDHSHGGHEPPHDDKGKEHEGGSTHHGEGGLPKDSSTTKEHKSSAHDTTKPAKDAKEAKTSQDPKKSSTPTKPKEATKSNKSSKTDGKDKGDKKDKDKNDTQTKKGVNVSVKSVAPPPAKGLSVSSKPAPRPLVKRPVILF